MTAAEVLEHATAAGVTLVVVDDGAMVARPRAAVTDELRAAIREHKDQLVAVLRLRDVHRSMGFTEEDVRFIEAALLSGRIREIRVAASPTREPAA